ncbi:MAG TPA: CpaF family protein [Tepidisphaeraceae bacterium]|nr:CpaF family protein [Tepidisphaeraceae bacterium]
MSSASQTNHASPVVAEPNATTSPLSALKWHMIAEFGKDFSALLERRKDAATRCEIELRINEACAASSTPMSDAERAALREQIKHELLGFGPIQPLLEDSTVSEVMVNRANRVYVERKGKMHLTDVKFEDDAHVRRIIERILLPLGRHIDENNPLVDARLPDGSRVNAVIPPCSVAGPCITIRKFSAGCLTTDDLVKFGTYTNAISDFLKACVLARLNIVVAGGTGSGKTTLLNVLSSFIPFDERIVTIEDAAELKLAQDHVITLEAKRPNRDGSGEVTTRELVRNALRMRPERIVVGEVRGGDALDMLQAMNTGHDGSMTTLHANSPRDAISRIETMTLMGGIDFPIKVVREQISSAIQLIIQQARLRDGSRKITSITEIAGMEGDKVVLQELFHFKEEGADAQGKTIGQLRAAGIRPRFMPKLEAAGFKVQPDFFTPVRR